MDYILRSLIILLLTPSLSYAVESTDWIKYHTDSQARALFSRDANTLRIQAQLASIGSDGAPLQSTAPNANGGKYIAPVSTVSGSTVTPKIATNVKIPYGNAAGAAVGAVLTAAVTKSGMAKAGMALVRANPYLSTALTIGWLVNAGYQYFSDTNQYKQIWQPSGTGPSYYYNSQIAGGTHFTTEQDACNYYWQNNNPSLYNMQIGTYGGVYNFCQLRRKTDNGIAASIPLYPGPVTNICNAGYTYTSGHCLPNTGTVLPVKTDSEVIAALSSTPYSGTSDTQSSADGVLGELIKNDHVPEYSGIPQLRGPNGETSITTSGSHETTTYPDGSTSSKNTQYTTNFIDDSAQISEVTTITNISAGGNPETTTTTKPVDVDITTTQNQVPSEPPKTDCQLFPESIGCSKYGTPAAPETLQTTNSPSTISYTSWGDGSCPASVSLPHGITWDYTFFCSSLIKMKPVVVGAALLLAMFIVAAGVKE